MDKNARSSRISFENSPYFSIKHDNYFEIYDALLTRYQNERITFVEIGVLNGGSLFMWRNFFGPEARVIGIDNNPEALKFRDLGFDIYIGDQSSNQFWANFYSEIGNIDVLLDDGGHTNIQQITTVMESLPFINDGGLIVIEDTHTSYMKSYGNPSKYSFVNFAKTCVDIINARFQDFMIKDNMILQHVYEIQFFESIIAFRVDRAKAVKNKWAQNKGVAHGAKDLRYSNESTLRKFLILLLFILKFDFSQVSRKNLYVIILKKMVQIRFLSLSLAFIFRPVAFMLESYLGTELYSRKRRLRRLFSDLNKFVPRN